MGFNTFPCNPYPISTEELNKGNNDDLNTRVAALESDVSDLNSNKANQITIAPFFNAETAYTAGDLVYYNSLTYRCTNDHEGAWDADDFAATTISNELDSLRSGLKQDAQYTAQVVDANETFQLNNSVLSHRVIILSIDRYAYAGVFTLLKDKITISSYTNCTLYIDDTRKVAFSVSADGLITIKSTFAPVNIFALGIL